VSRVLVLAAIVAAMNVAAREPGPVSTEDSCCKLIELRQYNLHPGQRDVLIELFDREFVETQEAVGMTVIGQFRDLDRPDYFVWLRGFHDMEARARGLAAFYGGPVWHAHSQAANATMIDSDNVLLLEPAAPGKGFEKLPGRPGEANAAPMSPGLITATLYYVKPEALIAFGDRFDASILKKLEQEGARTVAQYVTSNKTNNFPRLPIRSGEHIFVWFAQFDSSETFETYRARLAKDHEWQQRVWSIVRQDLTREPEVLRLAPTSRSRLRVLPYSAISH